MFLLACVLFLSSLGSTKAEDTNVYFADMPLARCLEAIRPMLKVEFVIDPSIEHFPSVTIFFDTNASKAENLEKLQRGLLQYSLIVSYMRAEDLVVITKFSNSVMLSRFFPDTDSRKRAEVQADGVAPIVVSPSPETPAPR
jgi:type II secretory pathway component GspD/PulD (secretin)